MSVLRLFSLLAVLVLVGACSGSPTSETLSPISPEAVNPLTSRGPQPPRGSLTIAGRVSERLRDGSLRPFPNVNVNAWVQAGRIGYSYMWANGERRTDSEGRYQLQGLPPSAIVTVDAWSAGYVQQCASPPIRMEGDATVDVQLVSKEIVSASPETVSVLPGFRNVSGTVFENSAEGKRPVQGAMVAYEPVMDSMAAWTYSDANGRYLLCGIPIDQRADVAAALVVGRVAYVTAQPGQTTGVDILLP